MQYVQIKECVCRVVQKVQWNCVERVPNERLCVQCSAKVTIKLLCTSSKLKIVCAG